MTAKTVFSGTTHNVSGANGYARSADGFLDIQMPEPHPAAENLFGAAWSACFMGAIGLAAAQKKVALPEAPSVDTTIDLLMEGSEFFLRAKLDVTIPGVDRPAIAVQWPTVESECIVLDVGANVGADARQLVEFALMGAAMARALFGMERPTVGLLNIGVEEVKGLDEIKAAYAALKDTPLPIEFRGFVEGDDIGHGAADVVVTDGFTGNIALKTAEGTAKQIGEYFRAAMRRSLLARLGAVLAQGVHLTWPELSGAPVPRGVLQRLEPFADDPVAFRAAGLDVTGELCARLLTEGVRGLHFYTLNRSTATAELVHRLGLTSPAVLPG